MAFALVSGPHAHATPAEWTGFTFAGDPSFTAGNHLVMFVMPSGAAYDVTIDAATAGGQAFTNRGKSTQAGAGLGITVLTLDNISSTGTKTFVVTPSSGVGSGQCVVYEFSGGDTAGVFDATNGTSQASQANPSVSLTTATANAMIVAVTMNNSVTCTEGSGYTLTTITSARAGEYDLDAGAAGAKTVDFVGASDAWAMRAVSLKLATSSAQLLAPISDISAGPWLTSSGSPAELWQMIDGEESPDFDYDYTTSAGTMEVKFSPGSAPTLQSGHTLRYRLRGNGTCDALVKLKVGSTVLAQWTETNVPAVDTDYEHTLDSSPSFTISDYTDLRISVEAVP
jgi:hypothetical protein